MQYRSVIPLVLTCLCLLVVTSGCDGLGGLNPFSNEKEISGVVENVTDNSLTVEGIEYSVTSNTKFEGVTGLQEISVGVEVEIDYEEKSGSREAKEVDVKTS